MKIPDRWIPYTALGKQIKGTRFITFKVPLKKTLCAQLEEALRFTPQMLLEKCPEMKMIVDLTNTTRYYDGKEFTENGVEYIKIATQGHVIPASNYIQQFFTCVDDFLSSSDHSDSLIGIHCTHGLNRTAYFVCCYMIHRLGIEPKDAVEAFEEARGHKVERLYYVEDLLKRGMGAAAPPGYTSARDTYSRHTNRNATPYSCPPRHNSREAPPPDYNSSYRHRPNRIQEGNNGYDPSGCYYMPQQQMPGNSRPVQENWRVRDSTTNYHQDGWANNYPTDFQGHTRNAGLRGRHRSTGGSANPGAPVIATSYAEHRRLMHEAQSKSYSWKAPDATSAGNASTSSRNKPRLDKPKSSRWGI